MGRQWFVFADESGDFDFTGKGGTSKYFAVGSITFATLEARQRMREALDRLGDDLLTSPYRAPAAFHAHRDSAPLRERVFEVMRDQQFVCDVTIVRKSQFAGNVVSNAQFYKEAWHRHISHLLGSVAPGDEVYVIAASLNTKDRRSAYEGAVQNVVTQHARRGVKYHVAAWPDDADRCIQAADYALWAKMHRFETGSGRWDELLPGKYGDVFQPYARPIAVV